MSTEHNSRIPSTYDAFFRFALAQDVFHSKTVYNEIHSTSLLKWYAKPKTRIKKSSSSKRQQRSTTTQYEFVHPCYICPNVQQAIAGYEDTISSPNNSIKATTSLVRFIGYRVSYRDKIQTVPLKHLLPYNSIDSSMYAITNNDMATDRQELSTKKWNANLMSLYLKSLQSNQQEFKKSEKNDSIACDFKLKVEEAFLQIIASSVFEQEQQKSKSDLLFHDTDIEEESYDNEDRVTISPQRDVTSATSATTNTNAEQVHKTVTTVTKLRAGDVIDYWYVVNRQLEHN